MVTDLAQVHITRVFDADVATVFRAWTDPAWLARWFAPQGCDLTVHRLDGRVGGQMMTTVIAPGHPGCDCLGVFTEFEPPHRLAYDWSFCNLEGCVITSAEAGRGEWPDQTTVTVTFRDLNGRTEMTMHQTVSAALAEQTGAAPSWRQMFDRLSSELEKRT